MSPRPSASGKSICPVPPKSKKSAAVAAISPILVMPNPPYLERVGPGKPLGGAMARVGRSGRSLLLAGSMLAFLATTPCLAGNAQLRLTDGQTVAAEAADAAIARSGVLARLDQDTRFGFYVFRSRRANRRSFISASPQASSLPPASPAGSVPGAKRRGRARSSSGTSRGARSRARASMPNAFW